ncbi:MAG: bifunctional 4-hydroxy-3-methylbut-2-enyl diphosphate reductase/30S ribosomal protein S1 [Desulfotomaculaceae bacterium]|nr:bifunctional 4-hydroxy-3-methylbut-2-enyl diphosphate reductase/30S ribosomal protein S1 [Desulfotomaculaceae bacterium]
MEVCVAKKAGFCFGVNRAIELTRAAVLERAGPVYTIGPLIHNSQVMACLSKLGVKEVTDLAEAEDGGNLVIRSHGVGPEIVEAAEARGLKIVDATCPFVRKAQVLARDLTAGGFQVVVFGDKDHPEVRGIKSWSGNKAIIVSSPAEAGLIDKSKKIGLMVQTTQSPTSFKAIIEAIERTGAEFKIFNTICNATVERQQAALDLARQVEVMIVAGGANSANTRKLAGVCRASGTTTYHVETASDLDPAWFGGVKVAGLTAGASTPDWIIEEVKRRMIDNEGMGTNEEMLANEEEMKDAVEVKSLRNGEIVKGVVVHVSQDEVMVDVGAKSEGVIPIRELSCCDVNSPQDIVKVGDEIEVCVLKAEDNEGRLILSKEKADAEKTWAKLEEILNTQEAIEGTVREVVKGGLLVDVGTRAFLPASLVERGYVEDLSKYLGQVISARVIEINRGRKKVILSRKAVLDEEFARLRQEMLESLQEGQIVKGIVRRLTQFGAFVDIGGVDGLLHVSEMSWHRINHPSEVVKVGDELDVMVLRVDRESEKISLGLKQVLPNPWDSVDEKYSVGSIVLAKVVRLAPFGAFVQLEPGVEGLVHISHLADRHVAKPDEVVTEGEEVNVKVLSVDKNEKRIRLSIREVAKEKQEQVRRDYSSNVGQNPADEVITIGDMVGNLFDKKD